VKRLLAVVAWRVEARVQEGKVSWSASHQSPRCQLSGPHIHPGDVLSVNEKDEVYHRIAKLHTDSFCNGLLDDLMPVIEKGVCDRGNNAVTKGCNDGENMKVTPGDKVAKPLPLSGTTKEDS